MKALSPKPESHKHKKADAFRESQDKAHYHGRRSRKDTPKRGKRSVQF